MKPTPSVAPALKWDWFEERMAKRKASDKAADLIAKALFALVCQRGRRFFPTIPSYQRSLHEGMLLLKESGDHDISLDAVSRLSTKHKEALRYHMAMSAYLAATKEPHRPPDQLSGQPTDGEPPPTGTPVTIILVSPADKLQLPPLEALAEIAKWLDFGSEIVLTAEEVAMLVRAGASRGGKESGKTRSETAVDTKAVVRAARARGWPETNWGIRAPLATRFGCSSRRIGQILEAAKSDNESRK